MYEALRHYILGIVVFCTGDNRSEMWQKTKKTRHNQFSVCEWQVFEIQMVGAESCKKRVTTEYRSSLL